MNNREAYDSWSRSYDSVLNKTRDLEKQAIEKTLSDFKFENVLELGCGTGKNTSFLAERSKQVIAVDFSEGMLARAREKTTLSNVNFMQADVTSAWSFTDLTFDLITCCLILEHIADLDFIFAEASKKLQSQGQFYICEFHPFKQYQGSKARFETGTGIFELECFVHHATDYTRAAEKNGFQLVELNEWFDDDDRNSTPRLISFIFRSS